jgi:phytoene desaturase
MKKAVVIGAGIGGMATAIRLACQGYAVEVFEASDHVGGKLHAKSLGDFRFDLGPSLFTLPHLVEELFDLAQVPIANHFEYERLDSVAHYFWEDGVRLKAPHKEIDWAKEIADNLGESERSVSRYLNRARWIYENTREVFLENSLHRLPFRKFSFWRSLFFLPFMPIWGTLHQRNSRYFKNPKTVQLMNRYATYNGSNPYRTPAMMSMIPHLEHGIGAFMPRGGMHAITLALGDLMKHLGIQVHLNAPVERVVVENDKVQGVMVNGELVSSPIVVSNVDAYFTYHQLLKGIPFPEKVLNQERSSSAIIFYWGMGKTFEELDVHNLFFSNDYKKEFEGLFDSFELSNDVTVYVNITSKVVKSDAPTGKENWFVMVNAPRFDGNAEDDLVRQTRERILQKLNACLGYDVASFIECEEVLTPSLIEKRTGSYAGSLYGTASNNMFSAFLRHPNFHSKFKGLYFVGGSVHPGGGIPLCLNSAAIVAKCIQQDAAE